jgi:hypothetical protein
MLGLSGLGARDSRNREQYRVPFGHIQVTRCKSLAWTTDSVQACADQRSRLSRDGGAPAHARCSAKSNSARKQVHFDPRDFFGYFLCKRK